MNQQTSQIQPTERFKYPLNTEIVELAGHEGDYYKAPGSIIKNGNWLDVHGVFLEDSAGKEWFCTVHNPETQQATSELGSFMIGDDPSLSRLQFPRIKQDALNGEKVALMEVFGEHAEADLEQFNQEPFRGLTGHESAFLTVFNRWAGNDDYKAEHVMIPKAVDGKVGLIDLERAFTGSSTEPSNRVKTFCTEMGRPDQQDMESFVAKIENLTPADWQTIQEILFKAGFEAEKVSTLVDYLHQRTAHLRDNFKNTRQSDVIVY
jgi:hypothetical protein